MTRSDLLLISCYELGHQPMGLALASAFLERAGYGVDTIDIAVEPLHRQKVERARFVGISVPMHTALRLGIGVAEEVRRLNQACHICFYGLYASLNAGFLLERVADSVIGGEYEEALVGLVEQVATRAAEADKTVRHPPRGVGEERSSFSVLARLAFPVPLRKGLRGLDHYAALERNGERHRAGHVEATRGCLHLCLHCPIPPVYQGRFFVVPRETVLQDIRQLVAAGATHITFGDPDFLNGPGHSLPLVRAMHEESPELTFDFTAKIGHLVKYGHLLRELAGLGCIFIVSAVESLRGEVLEQLEKGHTREDVTEVLMLLRNAGIAFRPTWVPFTPWTRLEDYLEMLEWIAENSLVTHVDPVQYGIRLLVPPGSSLLDRPGIQPFVGPLAPDALTYRWTHPDPRMEALQRDVSRLVKRDADGHRPATETFERVRALAWEVAGPRPPRRAVTAKVIHKSPPRLTESWFC